MHWWMHGNCPGKCFILYFSITVRVRSKERKNKKEKGEQREEKAEMEQKHEERNVGDCVSRKVPEFTGNL